MIHFDKRAEDAPDSKPFEFIVEGMKFTSTDQYKTGAEIKVLRGIPSDVDMYLKIVGRHDDELIDNADQVDLALPKKEFFYVKNKYEFFLNEQKYTSFNAVITGEQLLILSNISNPGCYDLYQKLKAGGLGKISLQEELDLAKPGVERFVTKDSESFFYFLDGEKVEVSTKEQTPAGILSLAGFNSNDHYLVQLLADGSKSIFAYNLDEKIEMSCVGLVFETASWLEVVDIEEFGGTCKEVPPAKSYKIKIQNNYHFFASRHTTPEELIRVAGTPGKQYDVKKFLKGNPMPVFIPAGTKIDLTELCLTRFILQPCEQKAGCTGRKAFELPDSDMEFLNQMGLPWETLPSPGRWLLVHNFPIPAGYNVSVATVALSIEPSYPGSQIDMAYFYPPLAMTSNRGIRALASQTIDGKSFQRWSRHRSSPSEWISGVDCICTHLSLVTNWLEKELAL